MTQLRLQPVIYPSTYSTRMHAGVRPLSLFMCRIITSQQSGWRNQGIQRLGQFQPFKTASIRMPHCPMPMESVGQRYSSIHSFRIIWLPLLKTHQTQCYLISRLHTKDHRPPRMTLDHIGTNTKSTSKITATSSQHIYTHSTLRFCALEATAKSLQ